MFARPLQDLRTFAAKCSHARCKPCWPGSLFPLAHLIVPDGPARCTDALINLFFRLQNEGREAIRFPAFFCCVGETGVEKGGKGVAKSYFIPFFL